MKIRSVCAILLAALLTLSLTSCRVNWFDTHYDVQWWVIAIPSATIILAAWLITGLSVSKKKYRCPNCNHCFKPKWWRAALSVHFNSDRVLKCPNCGKKGFCKVANDQSEK